MSTFCFEAQMLVFSLIFLLRFLFSRRVLVSLVCSLYPDSGWTVGVKRTKRRKETKNLRQHKCEAMSHVTQGCLEGGGERGRCCRSRHFAHSRIQTVTSPRTQRSNWPLYFTLRPFLETVLRFLVYLHRGRTHRTCSRTRQKSVSKNIRKLKASSSL